MNDISSTELGLSAENAGVNQEKPSIPEGAIVGARRKLDGSMDFSRAMIAGPSIATQQEDPSIKNAAAPEDKSLIVDVDRERQLISQYPLKDRFTQRNMIRQAAKDWGISEEDTMDRLKLRAKQDLQEREKGPLYHYHRTTVEKALTIINNGALLSRDEMEKAGIDTSKLGWSISDQVMMTRDGYNQEGQATSPGVGIHNTDAYSGFGPVIFVFEPSVMDSPGYNAIDSRTPTSSKISLAEHEKTILLDETRFTPDQFSIEAGRLAEALQQKGLTGIKVGTAGEWIKAHYPNPEKDAAPVVI